MKTKTITSTQLAEMLGKDRKVINRDIRKMFLDKIKIGKIFFTINFDGHVFDFYLPELEAKSFIVETDINYLEKITQFWIDNV